MVLAALGGTIWSELVVGVVECGIVGMAICALGDALSLFLLLLQEVQFDVRLRTVGVCAVVGDRILRFVTLLAVMVIDGDDMEYFPHPNKDVYLAESN